MNERTHIPSSAACGRWETLLADALDGLLLPADEATFLGHMAQCSACAALFEEARRGREWLGFLSDEPEVPEGLVDRILATTGPGHKLAQPIVAGVGVLGMGMPAWQRPGLMGQMRRWAEPRLMMTMAMAFFSIALTLNLVGVRLTDFRLSDLRPTSIRSYVERRVMTASVPFVRYYDHLRFVYEVQSRVRELRNQNDEAQPQQNAPAPGESEKKQKGPGGSKVDPPQQSVQPELNPDLVETKLSRNLKGRVFRQGQEFPRSQTVRASERSTIWTA